MAGFPRLFIHSDFMHTLGLGTIKINCALHTVNTVYIPLDYVQIFKQIFFVIYFILNFEFL